MVAIEVCDLSVGYKNLGRRAKTRQVSVAAGLNAQLKRGTFACLLGPNGSGKSTLIRTIAGMISPLAGTARVLGHGARTVSRTELARSLAVVLTEKVDIGMLNVWDLVGLGRYPHTGWRGRLTAADRRVIWWAIEAVGVAHLADRHTNELSDGEHQRVMIARALAQEPVVLLLDEPTAYLDVRARVQITELLRRLAREKQIAVLLSTHDLELALNLADQLWLMSESGLTTGCPEDLVLSNAVADTFADADLFFDVSLNNFVSARPIATVKAVVIGEGLPALLAKRMLMRLGYGLINDADDVDVAATVVCSAEPAWLLTTNNISSRCVTLAEVAEKLSANHAEGLA